MHLAVYLILEESRMKTGYRGDCAACARHSAHAGALPQDEKALALHPLPRQKKNPKLLSIFWLR
jgi:hypothetical protein